MSGQGACSLEAGVNRRERCICFLEELVRRELSHELPDVARVSIALGLVEVPLTLRNVSEPTWPENYEVGRWTLAFRRPLMPTRPILCRLCSSQSAARESTGGSEDRRLLQLFGQTLYGGLTHRTGLALHEYTRIGIA